MLVEGNRLMSVPVSEAMTCALGFLISDRDDVLDCGLLLAIFPEFYSDDDHAQNRHKSSIPASPDSRSNTRVNLGLL